MFLIYGVPFVFFFSILLQIQTKTHSKVTTGKS